MFPFQSVFMQLEGDLFNYDFGLWSPLAVSDSSPLGWLLKINRFKSANGPSLCLSLVSLA